MRGHEPGGKNHSTDSSGVGGGPMKAELNGEPPQGADGDGCLGSAKDRPASLPCLALSVRQPWAWGIIHGGKDIENRSWQAVNRGLLQRGLIAVHAAKGMTRDEYEDAAETMAAIGVTCPPPAQLLRGGIIGSVEVVDVVSESKSPWFFGPRGLVLRNPVPCEFIPAVGALGYFKWEPGNASIVPTPARWMLPAAPAATGHASAPPTAKSEPDLFS